MYIKSVITIHITIGQILPISDTVLNFWDKIFHGSMIRWGDL